MCFSNWKSVTSGVPQGISTGTFNICNIYMKDLDEFVGGMNTYNSKMLGVVHSEEEGYLRIQGDMDQLES